MKSRKILFFTATVFCFFSIATFASVGIVKFPVCVSESKHGKQEQEAFENVRNQITNLITDIEKQLTDLGNKFNDPEFIDSLSPEAEQEMKARYQTLSEEHGRYQNQYMQVMQQANMKLIQVMSNHVSEASQTIAKKKKLSRIERDDACFFYKPEDDVTALIIEEMDKNFDKENPSEAAAKQTKKSEK